MRLDLSEIAAHVGKRFRYEIEEPPIEDPEHGLKGIGPVTGHAVFSNAGSTIVVRGHFKTAVEIECARCLKEFRFEIDLPIEEELPLTGLPPWISEEEEEAELPEDEKEPLFVDNIFDLTEYFRQSILVAIPIKPLCSEACKGLCPRCGAVLTDGTCECGPETEGSPFGALAALLEKTEDEESES